MKRKILTCLNFTIWTAKLNRSVINFGEFPFQNFSLKKIFYEVDTFVSFRCGVQLSLTFMKAT